LTYNADQVELWFADRKRKRWEATSGQLINTPDIAKGDLEFWLRKAKTGSAPGGNPLPSRPGGDFGAKKEKPAAVSQGVPEPRWDWPALAAQLGSPVPPGLSWSELDRAVQIRLLKAHVGQQTEEATR
jgi:hypothetical protein